MQSAAIQDAPLPWSPPPLAPAAAAHALHELQTSAAFLNRLKTMTHGWYDNLAAQLNTCRDHLQYGCSAAVAGEGKRA